MKIYPAIDLIQGRCVRLVEGDFERETRYQTDPVTLAKDYEQAGAPMIHVVDLDRAKEGVLTNLPVIESMARAVPVPLQCGGGIRNEADLQTLFSAGVGRAVIGSLAVTQPTLTREWLTRFGPERLTLALDCRWSGQDFLLATAAWTAIHDLTLEQCLDRYAGSELRHVLCTDIGRDGTLQGPNIDLYRHTAGRFANFSFQASGGVSELQNLRELAATRVDAVVVGKALLDGRFSLQEGLSCLRAA